MRKFILVLFFLPFITLFIFSFTYSVSANDNNLKRCNEISKEEIATTLKNLLPDIKILEVNNSPVDGLCEIALEAKGRKGIIYLDTSQKYIISGSLLNIETKENLTQSKLTELNKVDVSRIPLEDAIILGDKEAKHRVIVFDDPD